jgi:epoxide hydrolase-like predicted phosphatase
MAIKAIIWDLGGVLVRTEDWGPRDRLATRLGISRRELNDLVFGSSGDYRAQLGQITAAQQWEKAAQKLSIPPSEIDSTIEEFFDGDILDSDLINYIRTLKPTYITALLSNAMSDLRHAITTQWHIEDAFHHLIISAEIGLMKPDAAIYQLALQQLSTSPKETVFIDDMLKNVEGARAVGIQAIHFQTPRQVKVELDALLSR